MDYTTYLVENLNKVRASSGSELTSECPFCGKFGSFYVNTESGAYICFKCEAKGHGLVGIVAAVEGISEIEAKAMLFRRAVDFIPRRKPADVFMARAMKVLSMEDRSTPTVDKTVPPEFIPCFDGKKFKIPVYLKSRGVTKEAIQQFGMGFANKGWFGNRVILPFECPNGRSFTARSVDADTQPRYLNPKDSGFHRLLYGWQNMEGMEGATIVICEGPMDCVRLWQHGINSVALLGKEMSNAKLALIARIRPSAITVMLDPEEVEAPRKVASMCLALTDHVYIAKLPDEVDPGDSTADQALDALLSAKPYTGDRTGHAAILRARLGKTME